MHWATQEAKRRAKIARLHLREDLQKRLESVRWYQEQTRCAPESPSHKEWKRLADELQQRLNENPEIT